MPADKLNVGALAIAAHVAATEEVRRGDPFGGPEFLELYNRHFARLVLEEAAKVCDSYAEEFHRDAQSAADICAEAIRARMP